METTTAPTAPATGTITVVRTPATPFSGESAEVHVVLSCTTARVTIYGAHTRWGALSAAEVNWSAIGSVSTADALAYAGAIALAAAIAPTLAPPTGDAV